MAHEHEEFNQQLINLKKTELEKRRLASAHKYSLTPVMFLCNDNFSTRSCKVLRVLTVV